MAENGTLADRVYEKLRTRLLQGEFLPGETLTLRRLSVDLGTSIMPVRQAMQRLGAEQVLDYRPNRGAMIPELSRSEAKELWDIRIDLEAKVAGLVAERAGTREIDYLREKCREARAAIQSDDVRGVFRAASAYGEFLYLNCGSQLLCRLVDNLRLRSAPHTVNTVRERYDQGKEGFFDLSFRLQDELVAAVARADAETARAVRKVDLITYRDWVIQRMSSE